MLAWRRISRLPSTNVSGCVTRGSHAHPDTTGRPDDPPITMGIRWHKGARTTYATNCINRQAKRGRGFAPHVRRAYCSGNGRWSPTKGTPRDAPESLPHTARWARPARSHRRPAGSRAHPHRRGPASRPPPAAPARPSTGGHPPGSGPQRPLRARRGIGESGHIGSNEPGPSADERTRLVTLDTVTRKDASRDFLGEDNVPREAITLGVATILEAREIALIATGEHKADIVARAVEGEVSQDVAATFLQRHANATAYLDLAAAAELTRIKTPWVLGPVEWTPELTERAVVWLAEQTGKAILKLTARDYTEHHLSPLLSKYGAAGPINGAIFNSLRDKIRGRRKLPTRKSVVVYSPHPDDDVISMGGLLRKLWENENATVVAYMTSGNIAVFDHDVRRHLDFVERAATTLGLEPAAAQRVRGEVEASFERKAPGDVDLPAVQDLKRVIRESEAVAALESVGLPPTAARFLNLPFYGTGQVRKDPIGPEDVAIVRALLVETRPDLVFVAGDLSDPHGTHRMCRAAVAGALDQYDAAPPEVWLYRGAWQEWSLTEADVLVPLSQDELRAKILAIFKHQSQKDTAPFPGGHDEREDR